MDDYRKTLIQKYFPREEWDRAYQVMLKESGGRADAVGDTKPIRGVLAPSVGLFQIRTLKGRPSAEQLKDPEFNVKYAANLFKEEGWKPWTAARNLGYAGKTIYASAGGNTRSVGGGVNMDTDWASVKQKTLLYAKRKGFNAKKTAALLDYAAQKYEIRTGEAKPSDIEDVSTRVEARETQKGMGIEEPIFKKSESVDRTKEYLSQIGTYKTKEEAMNDFELYKSIMEKEGVDTTFILESINKKFPEETEEEAGKGMFEESPYIRGENIQRAKEFFGRLFKRVKEPTGAWEKFGA